MDEMQESVEKVEEFGESPQGIAKRWKTELTLADKAEKEYRNKGKQINKQYRAEGLQANSFNVLFPNTEILRAAVYGSSPNPDVRRRFRDNDPIGKQVAEVISRSLSYCIDTSDYDYSFKLDVLDMLLPGRGISFVNYLPEIVEVPDPANPEMPIEQLMWEKVAVEHVNWEDFRHGPGDTWNEVPWVAKKDVFTYDMACKAFGEEIADAIGYDEPDDDAFTNAQDNEKRVFKTCEIWQIWDKESKKVYFINRSYGTPCAIHDDPLGLEGFFPCARPIRAIEDSNTLTPTALFNQYEQQAKELNKIASRRTKLIDALKLRGVYDSTLGEMSQLQTATDNQFIPLSNAQAFADRGGFEKAIWVMPIVEAANVLSQLDIAADRCKQIIYEILGISDILRGSSNAAETAQAQGIKAQWGGLRLSNMQDECRRYIRDTIRIVADIICGKFQLETLKQMTQVNLPMQEDVDREMMKWQMAAQQSQAQGQPPPPQPPKPVTWEQVMEVMRNDMQRSYKVDIETDSTIAASLQQDMQGLQEVMTAVTNLMTGMAPAVQAGIMPVEAVKEIVLAVTRRSKLGNAVEDALDKMGEPKQQDPQQAAKMQAEQEKRTADLELRNEAAIQKMQNEHETQITQMKETMQTQRDLMMKDIESRFQPVVRI